MCQETNNLDKELTESQYESKEYKTGKHDGMWFMIGLVQRAQAKGESVEEIIDKMFDHAEKFDKQ